MKILSLKQILSIIIIVCTLFSASTTQLSVQVSADVNTSPLQIRLSWTVESYGAYTIYRRTSGPNTDWGAAVASLAAEATEYLDNSVSAGVRYEYKIVRGSGVGAGYGYIECGIDLPMIEDRGTILLLVDDTFSISLQDEINDLKRSFIGDGWKVIQRNVSRSDSVSSIKALIVNEYNNDPLNVKTVLLFGHVPVPYSGNYAADGHHDHIGAWPTDLYYADIDGVWSDVSINNTSATDPRNHNVPGDGKFDQDTIPSDTELEIGRIDMYGMTIFSRSEEQLLADYVQKNLEYRYASFTPARKAIIYETVAWVNTGRSTFGYMTYPAFIGASNINANVSADGTGFWFPEQENGDYTFAYGSGGGWWEGSASFGNTAMFAANSPSAIFYSMFGSYFGDWGRNNNFLRAALASSGRGLIAHWGNRPHSVAHHLGNGKHYGYVMKLAQNNNNSSSTDYLAYITTWKRYVHLCLMGDPTLRLFPVRPPQQVLIGKDEGMAQVIWNASAGEVDGYHVYRSTSLDGDFTRLTSVLISNTTFTDNVPPAGYIYMVRAVRLEKSGSGTYYNPSQGVFGSNTSGPIVYFTSGPAQDYLTNQPFSINLSVLEPAGYWSTNGGLIWMTFLTNSGPIQIDTTCSLLYYGQDVGGTNTPTNTVHYTIDQTSPEVSIISGPAFNVSTNAAFSVQMTASENYGYWSVNGSTWNQFTGTSPLIFINSSLTLMYFGRDLAGNTSTTNSHIYTVEIVSTNTNSDTTPPEITVFPQLSAYYETNSFFPLILQATDGVLYWTTNGITWNSEVSGSTSLYIESSLVLRYYAVDTNGNSSLEEQIQIVIDIPDSSSLVYPNPCRLSETDVISFSPDLHERAMYVFSIAGELIWSGEGSWDLRNMYGNKVHPGIYIYSSLISSEECGKIVVLP